MNIGIAYVDVPHLAHLESRALHTIDWRASLRTSRGQARNRERERPVVFVVDQRMSMFFGSKRALKSVAAAEVAALGSWMVFGAGERVGAVVFNDEEIVRIRPRCSRARINRIFGAIARQNQALSAQHAPVESNFRLNQAIAKLLALAPHDCLICIVSDFAGADDDTRRLLRALARYNDVMAILIFDPLAQELTGSERVAISQGELQLELDMYAASLRRPANAWFSARLKNLAEILRQTAVPLMAVTTAEDPANQLARLLSRTALVHH